MDITADMVRRQNEICETAFAQRADSDNARAWWVLQVELYNDLCALRKVQQAEFYADAKRGDIISLAARRQVVA